MVDPSRPAPTSFEDACRWVVEHLKAQVPLACWSVTRLDDGKQVHVWLADDAYVADLATSVAGRLGGRVGVAPRLFLKKLVGDVLDRIDQYADFDPRVHYALTVRPDEMDDLERNSAASSPDDVVLDLG